ncbi:hypothetical protein ACHAXA_008354 [Cyclostephanos tholiformis]|uniref:Calcineurin-like phosphoesterase domain-containing protein n=1 Tax=Cyclostephanos tholiformis TaxID=382380 RepID=A0ABD3RVY7_9STRA
MPDDVPSSSSSFSSHRFLWLSDVHLDPYYGTSLAFQESYYVGSNCDVSDDDDETTTGRYGCDSPPSLVVGTINASRGAMTTTKTTTADGGDGGDPSFVIVTGDVVRHGIDQIYVTGDFVEGAESRLDNSSSSAAAAAAVDDAASASYHARAMAEAGSVMGEFASALRLAYPNSIIVICLGNNDVVPDYYLELFEDGNGNGEGGGGGEVPPTPETAGMLGVLYDALVGNIDDDDEDYVPSSILKSEDMSTFLRGGYYHRTLHDGSMIILSLNTVLYSAFHGPHAHRYIDDPGGQFAWMRMILSDCRLSSRPCSAMIVGHVPPAMGSYRHQQLWKEGYIRTYYKIVKEFDDVVMGQLFGHLHSDEFRVGLANEGNDGWIDENNVTSIPALSTPLLLGSSVTPLHGNNPSFRIVRYDRGMRRRGGTTSDDDDVGYRIVDYDSYAYSAIGGDKNDGGGWSKLYTFSEVYGDAASDIIKEEGLSSGTFRAIVGAMEDGRWGGESPISRVYRSFKLSGANREENQFGANGTCDSNCRDDYVCIFQSTTTAGYERCILERGKVWYRVVRRKAPGTVAGVLFAVIIVGVAFVKCRRMRRDKRKHYDFAPSVHDEVRDDGMDARDQEMI